LTEIKPDHNSIVSLLAPFTSSLVDVKNEFQRIMVDIATRLPLLEENLGDETLEAREVLNFICSHNQSGKAYGVKYEIEKFNKQIEDSKEILNNLDKIDMGLFKRFRESMNASSVIIHKMDDILSISENLKVFAINSIVHSHNIGDNGRGYQVISGEFIKLSRMIADYTSEITGLGLELDDLINKKLYQFIETHDQYVEKNRSFMAEESSELISVLLERVEIFYNTINGFLDDTTLIQQPIGKIMMEMQKQDIIHQQLDHLLESINDISQTINSFSGEMNNKGKTDEENKKEQVSLLTLLHVLVVNTEHQLDRINEDIINLVSNLEVSFTDINNKINTLQKEKEAYRKHVLGTHSEKQDSALEQMFQSSRVFVDKLQNNLSSIIIEKKDILSVYGDIADRILKEKQKAGKFLPVIDSITNLLTLAKIEQGRYQLNIGDLNDASDIGFSKDSMNSLQEIVSEIEHSYGLVKEDLNVSKSQVKSHEEQYEVIRKDLQQTLNFLSSIEDMFYSNFVNILDITKELFSSLEQYLDLFQSLRRLNQTMLEKVKISKEIHSIIDERLDAIGGKIDLEQCIFKDIILQKIVDKCTVMQERDSLKERFGELEIEDSSVNNITLF